MYIVHAHTAYYINMCECSRHAHILCVYNIYDVYAISNIIIYYYTYIYMCVCVKKSLEELYKKFTMCCFCGLSFCPRNI